MLGRPPDVCSGEGDPPGTLLQMPWELVSGARFTDYRTPGLILFTVLGVGPLIVVIGLRRQRGWAW